MENKIDLICIEQINELLENIKIIETEKVHLFQKAMYIISTELGDKIEKDGIPKVLFCSEKLFHVINPHFSIFLKVVAHQFIHEFQLIFSWYDPDNIIPAFNESKLKT